MPKEIGTLKGLGEAYDSMFDQSGRVYDPTDVVPTIHTMGGGNQTPKIIERKSERVRKLTPKECWRLMGFDDEDFAKASEVCSQTQLYKQAGNSIVVNCLEGILQNLLTKPVTTPASVLNWLDSVMEVSG